MSNRIPFLVSNIEVMEILQKRIQERHSNNNNITNNQRQNYNNNNNQYSKLLRHRDWIEYNVIQYCQATTGGQIHNCTNAFQLETILTKPKRTIVTLDNTDPQSMKNTITNETTTSTTTTSDDNQNNNTSTTNTTGCETTPATSNVNDGTNSTTTVGMDSTLLSATAAAATAAAVGPISSLSASSSSLTPIDTGFGLTDAESIQILNYIPTEIVEIHLMIEELQSRFTDTEQEVLLKTIARYSNTIPDTTTTTTIITSKEDVQVSSTNTTTTITATTAAAGLSMDFTMTNDLLATTNNDDDDVIDDALEVVYEDYDTNIDITVEQEPSDSRKRVKMEGTNSQNGSDSNGIATINKRFKTER